MNVERKRIFISELPETATQNEIHDVFSKYGEVASVEIKERKELGPKNDSLFFSYVNIEISDRDLQRCFKDFSNTKWHGQCVQLQVARESFLERLKREREENKSDTSNQNVSLKKEKSDYDIAPLKNFVSKSSVKELANEKVKSFSSRFKKGENEGENETTSEKQEGTIISNVKIHKKLKPEINNIEEVTDLVIKNNKNVSVKNGLHIASVGKEPIITISKTKEPLQKNDSEANLKRLQSLKDRKKGYQAQKLAIKMALSNVDLHMKNKIVFNEEELNQSNQSDFKSQNNSRSLFNEDEAEEEFVPNFNVKEQFQGKQGQNLLKLQSKYQNDKRFNLDERFLDNEKEDQNLDDESIEAEKKKELEILEQVIGKKIVEKNVDPKQILSKRKTMLRFDPSQPGHANLEVKKVELKMPLKKRKRKGSEKEESDVKQQESELPYVSKEVFYKVSDTLKDTFQEKQEFSLLSMFGEKDVNRDDLLEPDEKVNRELSKEILQNDTKNPFKYDSSDDEDEIDNIPHNNEALAGTTRNKATLGSTIKNSMVWSEPLFFKNDDYRLQEGFDFMERMKLNDKEFSKVRRDLKEIVKAKVRNNERKNKMFKKKLGGSNKNKRRKAIRLKKALKR